ncbi:protein translocase subunit SecF [Oceanobacter kriegii]|uniref:protein translocase subunit SecF n=1 Tax=Oceanobacter kriegii TaxID=64972 RepID=UPI00040BFFAF|nr:protein translocase subunit SecF [Oceanobacter kriegii]
MKFTFDFMKYRHFALLFSGALLLASIISLSVQGLNLGLDFTGGTLLEVQYEKAQPVEQISSALEAAGYKDVTVQTFGSETDILMRMSEAFRADLGNEVLQVLQQVDASNQLTLMRSEFVGANVGEELRDQGGLALLMALGVVMIYVAARFQFKFSVGSVAALFHDVLITLGVFSLFQLEFDLTVLAALLAVIGYSLNDTIVVADRIRENFRTMRHSDAAEIMNNAINKTLDRTLMTSFTTILVLLALLFVGGELIHNFAMALTVGIVIGTYSSIYVAATLLMALNLTREDLIPPEIEEEIDDRP